MRVRSQTYEVIREAKRQDEKWGEQHHADGTHPELEFVTSPDGVNIDFSVSYMRMLGSIRANFVEGKTPWRDILLEEVYEALVEVEPDRLREELIQVAAVAVQWVADIDSRVSNKEEENGSEENSQADD